MARPNATYDCSFGGIGLMLARQGNQRAWSSQVVYDRDYPPEIRKEIQFHHGGLHSERRHPGVYAYADGVDPSNPYGRVAAGKVTEVDLTNGGALTAMNDDVQALVEATFSGTSYVYAIGGRYVRRVDNAYTVSDVCDLGNGLSAKHGVAYAGKVLVALGTTGQFRSINGTTPTAAAFATDSGFADYLAVTHANDRLVRAYRQAAGNYGVRFLSEGADPLTEANWSGIYNVDDLNVPITGLANFGLDVLIAKENGLFAIQRDARAPNLVPELASQSQSENGKQMCYWAGRLWFPYAGGLVWWADGSYGLANLDIGALNETEVKGQITALAPAGRWLYVAVHFAWASSSLPAYTYLVKCRLRGAPGFEGDPPGGPLVAFPIAKLSNIRVKTMLATSIPTQPSLFLGYTTLSAADGTVSTRNVAYVKLPRFGQIESQETGLVFVATGSLYSGREDFGLGGTPFLAQKLEIHTSGLTTSSYLTYRWRGDGGSFQPVGANGQANVSPEFTLGFDQSETRPVKWLELAEDWTLPSNGSTTPSVQKVVATVIPRPVGTDLISLAADVGEGVTLRNNSRDVRSAETVLQQLKDLARQGAPDTLVDLIGQERQAVLLNVSEQEVQQQGNLPRRLHVRLTLKQVGATTSALASPNPAVYDGTSTYDTDYTYA